MNALSARLRNTNYPNQRGNKWDRRDSIRALMELVHETLMSYSQSLDPRTTSIDPAKILASFQALSSSQACPRLIHSFSLSRSSPMLLVRVTKPRASLLNAMQIGRQRQKFGLLRSRFRNTQPNCAPRIHYSVFRDKVKLRLFEPFSIRRRLRYLGNHRKVERSIISLGNWPARIWDSYREKIYIFE